MEPDYLTDKKGAPDAEVQELESLLSDARYKAKPRRSGSTRMLMAASVLLALVAAWLFVAYTQRGAGLAVVHQSGATARLGEGKWLRTTDQSAEVSLREIGTVKVAPQSQVRLVSLKQNEQRLELLKGQIHARVIAPPRLFIVETPATTAVDLGCEYVLRVTEQGDTELEVRSGAVALEGKGHAVYVPQGHHAVTRKTTGTGLPSRPDAPALFREALASIEASETQTVPQETLATLLREAKKFDAPTLFELMQRVPPPQQRVVAEQLAALIPPSKPGIVMRVLNGDEAALRAWWHDIYYSYDVQ